MKYVVFAVLILGSVFGALPPFAQTERELREILNNPKLHEFIPLSDAFEEIVKTEEGYLIKTNKREVRAIIHYKESGKIGPAEFTVEFLI
ncbi:MAG: hypothetical protein FJZ59_02570 [Chlamydiae bacterium]|jgi:hypothetical protein|nr:hypothetical protein [Chlamydiota bacterium]